MSLKLDSTPDATTHEFTVRYGGDCAALYLMPKGCHPLARDLLIQLPRDGSAGDQDPNVLTLKALAETGNAQLASNVLIAAIPTREHSPA